MRILVITNLYPNSLEPTRGVYNRNQCFELSRISDVRVISPLPWYRLKGLPRKELIDGIEVYHPRYFMFPKIGRSLYGFFFFLSLVMFVAKIYKDFEFDIIYAPWVYPDGFGSWLIARFLKKPIVIGALGSDINVYAKRLLRRKLIFFCLSKADHVISVSAALKHRMVECGVSESNVTVLLNGVDKTVFRVKDKNGCRNKLGLGTGKILLFVGNLTYSKGLPFLIKAFKEVVGAQEDLQLYLIGDGELRQELEELTDQLAVNDKVFFKGRIKQDQISDWMNASDLFCLPSLFEGCPNVVIEALSCGIPVLATKVGGIPELLKSENSGLLVMPGDIEALSNGLRYCISKKWNSNEISILPEILSWKENADRLYGILSQYTNRTVL